MQRLSISKGHAFILVYSVVSRQSLDELRAIYQEIVSIRGSDVDTIPVMLVGNKCDETASLREVTTSEGAALAKSWKCGFMETSAKTDHNVKELFQELLQLERRRTMSLQPDTKTSRSPLSRDMLKAKCRVM
jgi:DIRAS family, GTP-binding Ras-like 2